MSHDEYVDFIKSTKLEDRLKMRKFKSENSTTPYTEKHHIIPKHDEVRQSHGWQSKEGRKSISNAMKNKLVVRNKITGELMGKHDKSHPNIQNGTWVHHSYGRQISEKERESMKIRSACDSNANYSGISDNDIIEYAVIKSIEANRILPYGTIKLIARNNNIMFPLSLSNMRFNGNKTKGYTEIMKKKLPNLLYNKNFRTNEMKEKIRQTILKKNRC